MATIIDAEDTEPTMRVKVRVQQLESPYLTAEEAAKYMRYDSAHALRQATKKYGIPHIRRGYRYYYLQTQLDEFMAVATEATRGPRRQARRRR